MPKFPKHDSPFPCLCRALLPVVKNCASHTSSRAMGLIQAGHCRSIPTLQDRCPPPHHSCCWAALRACPCCCRKFDMVESNVSGSHSGKLRWEGQLPSVKRGGDLSNHTHLSDKEIAPFVSKKLWFGCFHLVVLKTLERDLCKVKATTEGSPRFCSTWQPQWHQDCFTHYHSCC